MKINQLKAGVVLSYLSTALSALISLVYTPVMLRILGQGEYGVYTLVNSVVANLGILSFGFGSAYIRFYSRYKAKGDSNGIAQLNGMFIMVFSVIAIIALFSGGGLLLNVENLFEKGLSSSEISKAKVLLCISVINIAISFPASVFTSYITANEKYVFLKAINMIKMVFSPMINLPILLLGFGSVGMVVTTLFLNVLADCINFFFCIKKLKMSFYFKKFNWGLLKEVWIFSFFIFLNIITDQINWNVDKFLLGMFQSSAAVAIYGVAAQLNTHYTTVFWSISNVFIPRINDIVSRGRDDSELTALFIRIGRVQFMVLALVLEIYAFFGKYFIINWAGAEYYESYIIGAILISAITIEGIQSAGIEMQRAKNLHKFRSVLCFAIALANIMLSIPLSMKYGAIGAAVGTALALVIGNGIIMNVYYHKRVGLDIKLFWKNIISIFPALILPTTYGFAMSIFFPLTNPVSFVVQSAIMVVLYCISMWFFGMNSAEKQMMMPLLKIFRLKQLKK